VNYDDELQSSGVERNQFCSTRDQSRTILYFRFFSFSRSKELV
jgi:hypothetical protein